MRLIGYLHDEKNHWELRDTDNNPNSFQVTLHFFSDHTFSADKYESAKFVHDVTSTNAFRALEWISVVDGSWIVDLNKAKVVHGDLMGFPWMSFRARVQPELHCTAHHTDPEEFCYLVGVRFNIDLSQAKKAGLEHTYDAFIVHAMEDKDQFVRPLAGMLREMNFQIWYDEFVISLGDNLRQSIDLGLSQARYGIVVLSENFFGKYWTDYELKSLLTREEKGKKVILPIWFNLTKSSLSERNLHLADRIALDCSKMQMKEIVRELAKILAI